MNKDMLIINRASIKELIDSGAVSVLEQRVCAQFCKHLANNYKWHLSGLRLDWLAITNTSQVAWLDLSDDELASFIGELNIGKYRKVGMIFSENEPGIVCSLDFIISNIDVLTYQAPPLVYVVAICDSTNNLISQIFMEIDGLARISGVKDI